MLGRAARDGKADRIAAVVGRKIQEESPGQAEARYGHRHLGLRYGLHAAAFPGAAGPRVGAVVGDGGAVRGGVGAVRGALGVVPQRRARYIRAPGALHVPGVYPDCAGHDRGRHVAVYLAATGIRRGDYRHRAVVDRFRHGGSGGAQHPAVHDLPAIAQYGDGDLHLVAGRRARRGSVGERQSFGAGHRALRPRASRRVPVVGAHRCRAAAVPNHSGDCELLPAAEPAGRRRAGHFAAGRRRQERVPVGTDARVRAHGGRSGHFPGLFFVGVRFLVVRLCVFRGGARHARGPAIQPRLVVVCVPVRGVHGGAAQSGHFVGVGAGTGARHRFHLGVVCRVAGAAVQNGQARMDRPAVQRPAEGCGVVAAARGRRGGERAALGGDAH
eukprot:ctg_2635.g637